MIQTVKIPAHIGAYTTNGAAYIPSVTEFVRLDPPEPIKTNALTPNAETAKVLKDMSAGKNVVKCESAEDMFRKLGI